MQCPVQLIFACLVGNRDLLYTTYNVPTISICRSDQRMKALDRLVMPRGVYKDIEEQRERCSMGNGGSVGRAVKSPSMARGSVDMHGSGHSAMAAVAPGNPAHVADSAVRQEAPVLDHPGVSQLPWSPPRRVSRGPQVGFRCPYRQRLG